jgi:hypothetical protein
MFGQVAESSASMRAKASRISATINLTTPTAIAGAIAAQTSYGSNRAGGVYAV